MKSSLLSYMRKSEILCKTLLIVFTHGCDLLYDFIKIKVNLHQKISIAINFSSTNKSIP